MSPSTPASSGPALRRPDDFPAPLTGPAFLSAALEVAGRLANDAAEVITATAGRLAEPGAKANPFDWVTETDRTLERHTRRVLSREFPTVPVLGEEYGGAEHGLPGEPDGPELLWIVDPVDGTANYVAGTPWCCFSLALVDAQGPVLGVLADPYQGQLYAAARGRGVRANGRPLPPVHADSLSGRLVFTEPGPAGPGPDVGELAVRTSRVHAGLRLVGSSALAVAQVALGRAAATILPPGGYHSWEVAGALALAAEAGAVVTDHAGRPDPLPLDGLVVAVPGVLSEVVTLLQ